MEASYYTECIFDRIDFKYRNSMYIESCPCQIQNCALCFSVDNPNVFTTCAARQTMRAGSGEQTSKWTCTWFTYDTEVCAFHEGLIVWRTYIITLPYGLKRKLRVRGNPDLILFTTYIPASSQEICKVHT